MKLKKYFSIRQICLYLCLLSCKTVYADIDKCFQALTTGNFATAMIEARKAADAGDPKGYYFLGVIFEGGLGVAANPKQAFEFYSKAAEKGSIESTSKIAMAYHSGQGVAQDKEKALAIARAAAQHNDPHSQFLVYMFISKNHLSYLDNNGKPDREKYLQLAKRSISERALDIEAYDALYLSAQHGLPWAKSYLSVLLAGMVGLENHKKIHALLTGQYQNIPGLKKYQEILEAMKKLGDSNASPQLFIDAQPNQMMVASLKACDKEQLKNKEVPLIISTQITQPITNDIYLPSKVDEYEHTLLISGEWQEKWTYYICGKVVDTDVTFTADGAGGAYYTSSIKPKK